MACFSLLSLAVATDASSAVCCSVPLMNPASPPLAPVGLFPLHSPPVHHWIYHLCVSGVRLLLLVCRSHCLCLPPTLGVPVCLPLSFSLTFVYHPLVNLQLWFLSVSVAIFLDISVRSHPPTFHLCLGVCCVITPHSMCVCLLLSLLFFHLSFLLGFFKLFLFFLLPLLYTLSVRDEDLSVLFSGKTTLICSTLPWPACSH